MILGFLKTKVNSKRHYVLVMAFAILLACGYFIYSYDSFDRNKSESPGESISITKESDFARSAPARLVIPKINIDTTFVPPLGLNEDQTIEVPDSYEQVGWYGAGATPGEIGPAVILGHVDSKSGPAVFYSLGQLDVGDEIEITREDGTVAKFKVDKLERTSQSNFPTMEVYGPTDNATLRLVTCSGLFDRGERRYSHNLIVYATLQ